MRLQKSIFQARASLIIGLGLFLSGLSQVVFILTPNNLLSIEDLSLLTVWQALSFTFGLTVGSSINTAVFTELSLWRGDLLASSFQDVFYSIVRLFLVLFVSIMTVLFVWAIADSQVDIVFVTTLMISLGLQGLSGVQRAIFSAGQAWWRLGIQFSLDGIFRLIFSFVLTINFDASLSVLIISSVIAQFLSIVLSGIGLRWFPPRSPKKVSIVLALRLLIPLTLASMAVQALLALGPFLMRTIGQNNPATITAFGVLLQISRLPVTISTPLTLPYLTKIAHSISDRETRYIKHHYFTATTLLCMSGLLLTVTISLMSVYLDLKWLTYAAEISLTNMFLASLVGVTASLSTFNYSVILLMKQSDKATASWVLAVFVFFIANLILPLSLELSFLVIFLCFSSITLVFFNIIQQFLSRNENN